MSNAELVKRLEGANNNLRRNRALQVGLIQLIDEAIAALSAQDDVRDRVLEEAISVARSQMCYLGSHNFVTTKREFTELIDKLAALKSKPAAPVVECDHVFLPRPGFTDLLSTECSKCGKHIQEAALEAANKGINPTPPAQEAPQSLVTFTEAHRRWVLGNRFPGYGEVANFEQWICAELDRRMGGK